MPHGAQNSAWWKKDRNLGVPAGSKEGRIMKTKRNELSAQINLVFILTAVFIALCLFLPVWQGAASEDLSVSLAREEKKLDTLQDQRAVLLASIERELSPEEIMQRAKSMNLTFAQIRAERPDVLASNIL